MTGLARGFFLNLLEDDELDEARFADWVKQASELPGERM
jgi:hypothetical protein